MKTYEIEVIKKGNDNDEGLFEDIKTYRSAVSKAKKESKKPDVKEVVLYGYTEFDRFKLDYYEDGKLSISIEG